MTRAEEAHSIAAMRELARRRLPRSIFDFFEGGAEDEASLRENVASFARLRLAPHILVDVASVDTTTTLLGRPVTLPLAIAPTGGAGFGRIGSDVAIARAAAAAGIPYTLSTSATASIERIAREAPGRLWFQAYMLQDKPLLAALIERAYAAGFEALMVTVDLPVGGKRERDIVNRMSYPFRFSRSHFAQFAARPQWLLELARYGIPMVENLAGLDPLATPTSDAASSVGRSYDSSFNWGRLAVIRDSWRRPLIVKGVLRPDDAGRLAAIGVDAIVVSNHGGRQLDGTIAPISALPAIVAAVAGRAEVWVDGGVRRGSDILKARALGAGAVLIGRPTLYGAFAGGRVGAARAIAILADELVRTMRLCGVPTLDQINGDLVVCPGETSILTENANARPRASHCAAPSA